MGQIWHCNSAWGMYQLVTLFWDHSDFTNHWLCLLYQSSHNYSFIHGTHDLVSHMNRVTAEPQTVQRLEAIVRHAPYQLKSSSQIRNPSLPYLPSFRSRKPIRTHLLLLFHIRPRSIQPGDGYVNLLQLFWLQIIPSSDPFTNWGSLNGVSFMVFHYFDLVF